MYVYMLNVNQIFTLIKISSDLHQHQGKQSILKCSTLFTSQHFTDDVWLWPFYFFKLKTADCCLLSSVRVVRMNPNEIQNKRPKPENHERQAAELLHRTEWLFIAMSDTFYTNTYNDLIFILIIATFQIFPFI